MFRNQRIKANIAISFFHSVQHPIDIEKSCSIFKLSSQHIIDKIMCTMRCTALHRMNTSIESCAVHFDQCSVRSSPYQTHTARQRQCYQRFHVHLMAHWSVICPCKGDCQLPWVGSLKDMHVFVLSVHRSRVSPTDTSHVIVTGPWCDMAASTLTNG